MNTPRPLHPTEIDRIETNARKVLADRPRNVDARDKLSLIATIHAAEDAGDRQAAEDARTGRGDYLPGEAVNHLLDGESPIRIWRRHRGLTLEKLATGAGYSKSFLSQIETGKKTPSLATLRAIADVLDLNMDDLV